MKKLVTIYSINAIERMSEIINEIKKLQEELETIINTNNIDSCENIPDEDLDSYENIPDEDIDDLLDDEYEAWVEANFDEENENDDDDDDEETEEPKIYNIYFSIEDFETLMEYLDEIPFGYVFDSTENEYIVRMDEDMADEIKELLEKQAYIEKYENLCTPAYYRIISVQNTIYYNIHYSL